MGVALSCSLDDDLESNIEAVLVRTISFEDEDMRHPLRSFSFNGRNAEHSMMRSYGSRGMMFDRSCSFKGRELETALSFKTPFSEKENVFFGRAESPMKSSDSPMAEHGDKRNSCEIYSRSPLAEPRNQIILSEKYVRSPLGMPPNERSHAALRLQKVYKSFRTRRQLADCAVVAEQKWWKLLDFAELKRSSISFFNIEKPETAFSRWSRARTRAAKVGKGLSKDEKARKLALQHWLEAIDPRHRYGHNLQFYYVKWLHCHSKQPFFYWLDIGEGREVNLERCPRSKLQQQCIKYLGPAERKAYEVVIEDGNFVYKENRKVLDTTQGPKDVKWIFVLSTSKTLYIGQKKKGTFQHSSFLAGGATLSAGRLVIANGTLQAVWPHSGHYLPTEENFEAFMAFLEEHNVDLTSVKRSPSEEEEEDITIKCNNIGLDSNSLDAELLQVDEHTKTNLFPQENPDSRKQNTCGAENLNQPWSRLSQGLRSKITKLEIPRTDVFDIFKKDTFQPSCSSRPPETPDEGYETAEESFIPEEEFMFPKPNLFDDDLEDEDEQPIPREKIMKRIDSHKGFKSYQLAQQLSSKWSTGAGPRISCMRDYPSELQYRILEHANLSPRHSNADGTPRNMFRSSADGTPRNMFRSSADGTPRNMFRSSPPLVTPMSRGTARRISPLAPEDVLMSEEENAINSA